MTQLQLWIYFLRLGVTGFGGPLALIAQIQKDLVEDKKIVSPEEFKRAFALIKSLPGPVGTQVVEFILYRSYGFISALVGTVLFILPSALMMIVLAIYYQDFQSTPLLGAFMAGMQGAAVILIVTALQPLTRDYQKNFKFWMYLLLSLGLLVFSRLSEPVVILVVGLLALIVERFGKSKALKSFLLLDLFLICLKAGGLAFGTGLAIVPMLQSDFVGIHQWVTKPQFMTALAFGQLTPGPIAITVTFVGYQIAGVFGAVVATVGIFLPGFLSMTTWFPRAFSWFSRQAWVSTFVTGAIAAVCAGILVAIRFLLQDIQWAQLIFPALLWALSFKWKIQGWAIVLFSGVVWAILQLTVGINF